MCALPLAVDRGTCAHGAAAVRAPPISLRNPLRHSYCPLPAQPLTTHGCTVLPTTAHKLHFILSNACCAISLLLPVGSGHALMPSLFASHTATLLLLPAQPLLRYPAGTLLAPPDKTDLVFNGT